MDPRVVTERETVARRASDATPQTRVPIEVRLEVEDPFAAYRRVRSAGGGAFLETGGGRAGWGYFGVDPRERLTVRADAVCRRGGETAGSVGPAPSLAALEGLLDGTELKRGECEVPYPCGVVGWLSYDIARELEDVPDTTTDDRHLPRIEACLYDRLVAWRTPIDDEAVTLRITACPRLQDDPSAAYERGRRRALELAERIAGGDHDAGGARRDRDAGQPAREYDASQRMGDGTSQPARVADSNDGRPGASGSSLDVEAGCSRGEFADRVRRIKRAIRDGETFQANVSQRLRAPATQDPATVYAALREVNPAPYAGLLEFPTVDLVSASPELLLEIEGDTLRTEPIAGTRPRGDTAAADSKLETELRTDAKENAEHAMLVDLERNDLGAVSEYGSVHVPEYRRVDRYASVMHLVTRVEGTRRPDVGLAEAIGAVFPGGTITGAPKPRTMALIDEVESTRRGPYTGSIGLFGFDGRATLNIAIRTLVHHDGEYHLRVGAGVVHDSDPEREYQETLEKAGGVIEAIERADKNTHSEEPAR